MWCETHPRKDRPRQNATSLPTHNPQEKKVKTVLKQKAKLMEEQKQLKNYFMQYKQMADKKQAITDQGLMDQGAKMQVRKHAHVQIYRA